MSPDEFPSPPPPATTPAPDSTKSTVVDPGRQEGDAIPNEAGGEAGSTSGQTDFLPPDPGDEAGARSSKLPGA